ncbi:MULTISPECIES: hypothetical protein [unclassified Amycolatopsis]|uniref:hypothetical protein n=1 Tax=unclassified Amycolatopsis TaxID=2618356 RepID=UPI00106EFA10|nr:MULTISPECIES: hypothetical protein [unclassified Amycolatopsis]
MTRKPEPLTEQAVDAFETELIQAFRRAVRTRDLRPVIELADFLVVSGATVRSRGGLLGLFWFQTSMLDKFRVDRRSASSYGMLGLQLVDEGWCTDADMETGISEYLFRLGLRKGSLPDALYDLMLETGKHRKYFQQAIHAANITREENKN